MRIGFVPHPRKRAALALMEQMISHLEAEVGETPIEYVISDEIKKSQRVVGRTYCGISEMKADVMICLGGDGTLLHALRKGDGPVLGVNVGSLGFLMEVRPEDAKRALDLVLSGEYTIEERTKLQTAVNGERLPDAANEVVVMTSVPSKIQSFEVYVDMKRVQKIRSDGIIISTPTGSTSYAMSAGGVIMDPRLKALQIVPVSPFKLSVRPLVIPEESTVALRIMDKRRGAVLVVDGNYRRNVRYRDDIILTRSKERGRFVRFELDFYKRYQEKLVRDCGAPEVSGPADGPNRSE